MKPSEGYIKLIINPKSGASSSKLVVRRFVKYLRENGFDVRSEFTTSLAHAQSLSTEAAVDYNCGMIIASGGDGTVREVAHGLEGSDKPMMILPSGTENLLANELGYDERLKTAIRTFDNALIRSLDLCKADSRIFTSIAGAGFDGDIVHLVDHHRKGHITHMEYFLPILETYHNHKFPVITVEADGQHVFTGHCLIIFGNISRYALGLSILHNADFSDGLLDLCIYKCNSKFRLIKHSLMTILKIHPRSSDVIYRQCKNIKISSDANVKTEIDGDPGPNLPLNVSIIPQAVKVLVPPNAKPAGIRTRLARLIY